ncbi:hypothetical protein [Parasediminibacterium sp. JCM 36343]|uniref:hypothetical protein n=1 Tax=Parasediminibacterium sp. JCM 36343 TaxID=3374279 RepID=UPI00397DEAD1
MTVKDYQDGKLIILSKALDSKAKILNLFYFLNFFIGGLFIFLVLFNIGNDSIGLLFFLFIISVILLIVAYRFINKSLQSERLFINKTTLKIFRNGLLPGVESAYDISLISKFKHLDKPEITQHPLAGQSYDYLGFQTEQQVINEMHGDNRISFEYENKTITFGENIYSWHFEELELLLYDITGNDFRYTDEFEKTFNED